MHVGHHAGDPAHVEVLAARAFLAGQQVLHVTLHGGFPMALVGHVDGKFLGVGGNLHVRRGQHKLALLAVQGEGMGAVAHGEHHLRAGTVDAVTGGDLRGARLQEAGVVGLFGAGRAAQHREDGADRDVDVDVGAAIEGIEQQQEVTARVGVGHRLAVIHFFRGTGSQVTAPGVGFQQDLVADHVQLLLRLALHVAGTGFAEHTAQRALADRDGDAGAGAGDDGDQLAQVGVDAAGMLLFDQVPGKRRTGHGMAAKDIWGPYCRPLPRALRGRRRTGRQVRKAGPRTRQGSGYRNGRTGRPFL